MMFYYYPEDEDGDNKEVWARSARAKLNSDGLCQDIAKILPSPDLALNVPTALGGRITSFAHHVSYKKHSPSSEASNRQVGLLEYNGCDRAGHLQTRW
jgi:hypothetical protein